ncbi:molybdate ABC transport system, ATP-binding protein [Corynebacterium kutscheri]|uniref:ABC-type spermidine/putrescine transport system, ATPase component n=1 Tax=Corynebacterium kutscheri TaxID=35755 RepID=A0A0F6TEJ7_9CORY|nr:ABC transporter ATP-binding protein [Corynebacterium kutscheri]AKE42234.1 ABC-type spermidine/putrescine transport system, ATPase component [Corynebacterium kutscheri]VEH10577.1 molybdate ABC transport system, ATP-binding protein [Corynebacterium kutscheri]VEH81603.1 molybdate ABC transport system, ATP-binding protein [Corynebacterium kutscheri]
MAARLHIDAQLQARNFDLTFNIDQGETLAVVGSNGAGKSTLIQLIAGILMPDSGSLLIDGKELLGNSPVLVHHRKIGYLSQKPLLFPHLNVIDNVAFGARAQGLSRSESYQRAEEELELVGCGHLKLRRVQQLSGGQAQRVAIARVLVTDPAVLLLDEPFAALDATVSPELRGLMQQRFKERTVVIVTHDFLDLVALADKVIEIKNGHIVASGQVETIIRHPPTAFLAKFVGLNLVPAYFSNGELLVDGTFFAIEDAQLQDKLNMQSSTPVHIVFPPTAIQLYPVDLATDIPVEDKRTLATVVAIEDRGLAHRVTLSCVGQSLIADITPHQLKEFNLAVETKVLINVDKPVIYQP